MRVLLVDGHPLFRQALAATVRQVSPGVAIEQFQLVEDVPHRLRNEVVNLILLDIFRPDSHWVGGLLMLKAYFPDAPVAIISSRDDTQMMETAIACGASGLISTETAFEELSAAIKALVRGESGL